MGIDLELLKQIGPRAYRMMTRIREFEARLEELSSEGLIRGSAHSSHGMEAVAVGVSLALKPQDSIASNHRGHAHCLARGSDPGRTFAEILGRVDGYCGGKGGSMHIAAPQLGILGTNGVVGASIGIATGAALAASVRSSPEVAVAYFGDGASNQGVLAEAMNLAGIWGLPVVFVCENNHYAQSSKIEEMAAQPRLSQRGKAYGLPSVDVDGMDVISVHSVARKAVERARAGRGPSLIIADTYRYSGHMLGDTQIYRSDKEVQEWEERDPVRRLKEDILQAGIADEAALHTMEQESVAEISAAERFARDSEMPSADVAFDDVYGHPVTT